MISLSNLGSFLRLARTHSQAEAASSSPIISNTISNDLPPQRTVFGVMLLRRACLENLGTVRKCAAFCKPPLGIVITERNRFRLSIAW